MGTIGEMADAESTPRARARQALIAEIKAAAGRQVADRGASGLSVRLVARELNMASSAIYRYFSSRDALLTALILDGYTALGDAVESAEGAVDRDDLPGRLLAAAEAIRGWALANPHTYALLYGSPVPGYIAPEQTIAEAARPASVLAAVLVDAASRGRLRGREASSAGVEPELVAQFAESGLTEGQIAAGLLAWSSIYGLVSFELFGHLVGSVEDAGSFFRQSIVAMAAELGLR